jgi:hypothetical protein
MDRWDAASEGCGMKNKRKENSVKSLITLYTVVVGAALSLSIKSLFDSGKGIESITLYSILLFVSFLVTLIPFYHGALRHLDDAYIENENIHIKDGALIFDFLLLLLHGIAFVFLSLLTSKPNQFIFVLTALLLIDVFWGLFAHFGSSSKSKHNAELKWTCINFVSVCFMGWYIHSSGIGIHGVYDDMGISLIIVMTCFARSILDYSWCRSFYFIKEE